MRESLKKAQKRYMEKMKTKGWLQYTIFYSTRSQKRIDGIKNKNYEKILG